MTRYILDHSFCLRSGFVEFLQSLLEQSRISIECAAVTLARLDVLAKDHPLETVRNAAEESGSVLRSAARQINLIGKSTIPPKEDAAREVVITAVLDPKKSKSPVVLLTRNPRMVLDVEIRLRDTQAEHRPHVEYGALAQPRAKLTVRPSWYTPGVRPSWFSRILGRSTTDPSPKYVLATGTVEVERPGKPGTTVATGSSVRTSAGRDILLGPRLGSGREGSVFEVVGNADVVCKIFAPTARTIRQRDKLHRMLRPGWNDPAVCWPLEVLGESGEPALGVVVKRARGDALRNMFLDDPAQFQKQFPWWTRRQSVSLALRLAEIVARLHEMGVVVGDLSADNVFINPQTLHKANPEKTGDLDAVSVIDCDSFQIEEYSCPVGHPEYTPSDRQGESFAGLLRAPQDDCFALAVLLFQLLVPGRHPYHCKGSAGLPQDWIKIGDFPYPKSIGADFRTSRVPDAHALCAWTHLSEPLRMLFGKAFAIKQTPAAAEWFDPLSEYFLDLHDPQQVFRSPIRQRYDLNIQPITRYSL